MSYRSHADLGGRTDLGPIEPVAGSDAYHSNWEARALALTVAMGATGQWNIDSSRATRESLPDYRKLSYFQIWMAALEKLCEARGLVGADELEEGHAKRSGVRVSRFLRASDVGAVLAQGAPTERPATGAPKFIVGQTVRARASQAAHHTRLPGYARGKKGTIERIQGCHVFADDHARGLGENPDWLYTVVFDAYDLWGKSASARGVKVSIDAWQPYLDAA